MSDYDMLVAVGRLLYEHKLWKEIRKKFPAEVVHGQSHLEKMNKDISALEVKFNNKCKIYFKTVSDKEKALNELCKNISLPFYDYIDEEQRANAIKTVEEIILKYKESKQ